MKNLLPRETEESSCVHVTRHFGGTPQGPQTLRRGVLQLTIETFLIASLFPWKADGWGEISEFESKAGSERKSLSLEDNTYPKPFAASSYDSLTMWATLIKRYGIQRKSKQWPGNAVIFQRDTTSWLYHAVNSCTCCQWQPTCLVLTHQDAAPCSSVFSGGRFRSQGWIRWRNEHGVHEILPGNWCRPASCTFS